VAPGDLYVAAPGSTTHGARFVPDAVAAGAVAVLTDPDGARLLEQCPVPVLLVPRPRQVVGSLAAWLYGEPAAGLRILGVTGTQGKTTTTRLAEGALHAAGVPVAAIGTVGTRIAGSDVTTALTTPEAPELHALFAVMRERGVEACAMEVSSHALVMGRVDGVVVDVAVFTNLGRDHLDFHADLEDYYAAKATLFTPGRARLGLVNVDDEHGRRLCSDASIPVRTYSAAGRQADWTARDVTDTASGSTFTVHGPTGSHRSEVRLPGDFNVSNALAALAALAELGYDLALTSAALPSVAGVPGRLETVQAGQPFLAVVDYAHKPDALAAVLTSLRRRTAGRLLVVLGAGGDRDRGKRPLMGEVAGRLADVLVVTDDNPRTEEPAAIRRELRSGAAGRAEVHEEGDRRAAIRLGVRLARAGDTVVVAGKGHETGQEVAGTVHPFDDRVELAAALEGLRGGPR
jgi:UDP-N-acetylmuramoyl-L-alanyl-D-glutamate--2,6-diaminopimelate ligase